MEHTKPQECSLRYWHSGGVIIQTKNQSDVRDAATILDHQKSVGDEFAYELVHRWNSQPDLLEACEKASKWADDSAWAGREEIVIMCEAAIAKAKKE